MTDQNATISTGKVRAYLDRLNRLDDDKAALAADRKNVLAEAKGEGFCTKTLNTIVRLERKDKRKLKAETEMVELYASAAGVQLP